ncbi:hypothetical protein ACIBCH_24645 [Amycolatopsis thailandensis]|uniref:hypothetical protein n=1 Tax=Amycolatopsis thailandensis TaxID=589330 RepID=UPI0037B4750B
MPRRPGGGESPRDSVEEGLRFLALDEGPDIRKLSRNAVGGVGTIMDLARTPEDWTVDAKAAAVLTIVQELVEKLSNPRWKLAAEAAFRLPAERFTEKTCESLAGRFRVLALRRGEPVSRWEAYRGYWMAAASALAVQLEERLNELTASSNGWGIYRLNEPLSPPRSLPISIDRTDVLYRFEGRRGVEVFTYRWITAHGAVDRYPAIGWYYNQPDAPVEIVPLANCELDGELSDLPQGGRLGNLKFSHWLEPDEQYFFAYRTIFNADQPCRPTILYEVRGLQMRALTVRAQFDPRCLPVGVSWFDVDAQNQGWSTPLWSGASEMVDVAGNGYAAHEFASCELGRKYGLRWTWRPERPGQRKVSS